MIIRVPPPALSHLRRASRNSTVAHHAATTARCGRSHPVHGDGSPNLGLADVMHLTCTDAVFGTHTALIDAFLAQTGLTLEPEPP